MTWTVTYFPILLTCTFPIKSATLLCFSKPDHLCTPYTFVVTVYKTKTSVNFDGADSVARNRSTILCACLDRMWRCNQTGGRAFVCRTGNRTG
jgi:hypothetical protein